MEKIFAMPCLYGTGFYYNKNSALAYVDQSGKTHISSEKNKVKMIYHNFIFLRGLEYLIFGFYFFVKNLVKMPFENENKVAKNVSNSLNISIKYVLGTFFAVVSLIFALLLLGYIPARLSVLIGGYNQNTFLNRLLVALIKVIFLYLILLSIKYLTPFRQFYRFNACGNYILNEEKSIHKPTNYLNYLVFSFCFTFIVLSLIGLTANTFYKPILNLIISLFCFTICYEILLLLEQSKFDWLKKSCIITSFLVTEKPSSTEIYIALSAFSEVKFMRNRKRTIVNTENFKDQEISFSSVYAENKQRLKNAGIDDISELEFLMCEVLNVKRGKLRLITKIKETQKKQIEDAVKRRIEGEPITKIFGRTNFFGYDFIVTKDVLSPRMETELLIETVIKFCKDKKRVLDIGTGSGVIAICIAKKTDANVTATDISSKALQVAKKNAEKNNVKVNFKLSDLFLNLKSVKKFDIIVSNPPYISSDSIENLDVEVKNFDPHLALDGGSDGLKFYRKIIMLAPKHLAKNGRIFFEVGKGQAKEVAKLLQDDFEDIVVIKDYNKIDRIVYAKLKSKRISKK